MPFVRKGGLGLKGSSLRSRDEGGYQRRLRDMLVEHAASKLREKGV